MMTRPRDGFRSVRLHLLLTLACLGAPLPSSAADGQPPVILILAGQSNMIGQGQRSELEASRRTIPANVELFIAGRTADAPPERSFGPELSLAHELSAAMPGRKFRLLKFGRGSTSIRAWAPEWSEDAAAVTDNVEVGALYPRFLSFLRDTLPPETTPHAILWFQGERDARFPAAATDYGPRLDDFIQRLRQDLGAPKSWFILGIVNPPYAEAAKVAEVQRTTPQRVGRSLVVSAEGLGKRSDALHYDTAGTWELGRRFAAEVLASLREDGILSNSTAATGDRSQTP